MTHDVLTLAHERMRDATVQQLREAVRVYSEGLDVGVYTVPVLQYLQWRAVAG